jgi:deoxyribodipyrimidine photo-lyase
VKPEVAIVWFKRDLRVADHGALAGAAMHGPVLPLYIIEPELWARPDASARQWDFTAECLTELQAALAALGQPLVIRSGDAVEILEALRQHFTITSLWSHEETGNAWTFARDIRVGAWARALGIEWHEPRQFGVIRRLKNRNGWAGAWDRMMGEAVTTVPAALAPIAIEPGAVSPPLLTADPCPGRQTGGRSVGLALLDSFLAKRGRDYRWQMSSPRHADTGCSRLSPHIAYGSVSLREITQATWAHQSALKADADNPQTKPWRASMTSFTGRLHWHCHFIQKLEDAPRIEHSSLHRAYAKMRPSEGDVAMLGAWERGETGLPFVDACMRSLTATGWINFRMRAMLMAVASYHLWQPWQKSGTLLARKFTDYEPGIHWSQSQMQSGTTGINTVRIYNPVKQGYDQDPEGSFVRRWVPELAGVPDSFIHEPWKWEGADGVLDKAYPAPIVDHLAAAKAARDRVWAMRKGPEYQSEARAIVVKHASRKGAHDRTSRPRAPKSTAQLSLFE